jgi:hypothetical protein
MSMNLITGIFIVLIMFYIMINAYIKGGKDTK